MKHSVYYQLVKSSFYVWLVLSVNLINATPLTNSYWVPFSRASVKTMSSALLPDTMSQLKTLSREHKQFFIRLYPSICNDKIPPITASIIRQNRALEIIQYLDQIHEAFFDYEILPVEAIDRNEEQKNKAMCHTRIVVEDRKVSPLKASKNNTIDYKDLDFKNLSFGTGLFNLSPESKISLQNIAYLLTYYTESTIKIKGHTDPKGSDLLNYELSKARAYSAYAYLKKFGVSTKRIETSYYGEDRLLSQKKREAERLYYKRLRRTEIFVTHGVDVVEQAVVLIQKPMPKPKPKPTPKPTPKPKPTPEPLHYSVGIGPQGFLILGNLSETISKGGIGFGAKVSTNHVPVPKLLGQELGATFTVDYLYSRGNDTRSTSEAGQINTAHFWNFTGEVELSGMLMPRWRMHWFLIGGGVAVIRGKSEGLSFSQNTFKTGTFNRFHFGTGISYFLEPEWSIQALLKDNITDITKDAARNNYLTLGIFINYHF